MKTPLSIMLVVLLVGCSKSCPPLVAIVSDATQTNALRLTCSRQNVSGLTLHVRGYLDGTGHVFAGNWETQALSGTVDWKIYHDWFQPSCTLHYHPVNVRRGSLSIEYEFH